mgnify:CR=1 FL=1
MSDETSIVYSKLSRKFTRDTAEQLLAIAAEAADRATRDAAVDPADGEAP